MEVTRNELGAIEKIAAPEVNVGIKELADMELCLVGGGQGDVSFG